MATELGKALADEGHQVHFITYQQPVRLNVFNTNIFYHEVRVPTYPLFDYPPYEVALASTMVDVIMNYDLDLLHVHYAIPHAESSPYPLSRYPQIIRHLRPRGRRHPRIRPGQPRPCRQTHHRAHLHRNHLEKTPPRAQPP